MIWEIGSVLKHLVLPPLGLGWLLVLAWILVRRKPAATRWLLCAFICSSAILSMTAVSVALIRLVEVEAQPEAYAHAQAIVILSGGRGLRFDADGKVIGSYPGQFTLQRIHAGARIARQTGLPVLVSSGKPDGHDPTEAEVMRRVLEDDLDVRVKWVEDRSRNTAENADMSAQVLLPAGVRRIVLVTSAFHMRRSELLFRSAGFDVVPASVNPMSLPPERGFAAYVPNAQSFVRSYYAFNELGGILYGYLRRSASPAATVGNRS